MKSVKKLLLLLLCCFLQTRVTNSRSSNLWKLNADNTRVVEGSSFRKIVEAPNRMQFTTEDDAVFHIITTTVHMGPIWIKEPSEYYCINCNMVKPLEMLNENRVFNKKKSNFEQNDSLDCGKPVNFTYYDNLVGILNRDKHPNVVEPQTSLIFTKELKTKQGVRIVDIESLEHKLKKAKKEKPKSVQLYNQSGNYWRLKGETNKAIECFRRALAVSPHNAEVLNNLARVLFTLQYLDDAIYLTKRSLEVQSSDKGAWQQYFTLGEILKAYGHYQEATIHLKHSLQLRPGFEPAIAALKEMENNPSATLHVYTLVIIICLVLGVLLVILSSVDNASEIEFSEIRNQRCLNKTLRSLKG